MDSKCDPYVTVMMGGEFRLLRTAKRAMRAEMTIVIVLALMTTWCVYALYKMVTSGNPFEPQSHSNGPKSIKLNLYSDGQMSSSSRIARLNTQDDNYLLPYQQQTKVTPVNNNNNNTYTLDYNSSFDYDTRPIVIHGVDQLEKTIQKQPAVTTQVAKLSQDERSSLLEHQAMLKNKWKPNTFKDDNRKPSASITNVHYTSVADNSSSNQNSTRPSIETKEPNSTASVVPAKTDDKDNEMIAKKIESKFNIIPIASFTSGEEPEDADYKVNLDDIGYDDVNGVDGDNTVHGLDSNTTEPEHEDTSEEDKEENDESPPDDDDSEEPVENTVMQNSTTTQELPIGEDLEDQDGKLDEKDLTSNMVNSSNVETRNRDDEKESGNEQQYNGRVTFDEPPSAESDIVVDGVEEDDEEKTEKQSLDLDSKNNKVLNGTEAQKVDDLPMDENSQHGLKMLPKANHKASDILQPSIPYVYRGKSLKETRIEAYPSGVIPKKGNNSLIHGVDAVENADGSTIITNMSSHRIKRHIFNGHEPHRPMMAPYELRETMREGKNAKDTTLLSKRSLELSSLKPDSSDTNSSRHLDITYKPELSDDLNAQSNNSIKLDPSTIENFSSSDEHIQDIDQDLRESLHIDNITSPHALDGITHLPMNVGEGSRYIVGPTQYSGKDLNKLSESNLNDILSDVINDGRPLENNASAVNHDRDTADDLHRENQLLDNLYNVDHGLLLYPSEMDEEKKKEKSEYKKKHSKYKKEHKHKMSKGYKKGGEKKKKHKKEEKKFLKEKGFKGAKKGKKVVKGKGGQGGKKGMKHYKDKGYKKKGFKNVYHKEEFGDSKKYFDEFRDKDFKKKWKKFDDKYDYKQMKKWQGKDVKKAKKFKDHGENYKKTGKSKWKKKLSKSSKKGEKHKSHGEKKKKKSFGF